jgi:hypothetical protein
VKIQKLVFPLWSVARQKTELVPNEKSDPEGGVLTIVTFVSQESVAITSKVTGLPVGPAHSTTILLEQEIWGGVLSIKVMV